MAKFESKYDIGQEIFHIGEVEHGVKCAQCNSIVTGNNICEIIDELEIKEIYYGWFNGKNRISYPLQYIPKCGDRFGKYYPYVIQQDKSKWVKDNRCYIGGDYLLTRAEAQAECDRRNKEEV